jgi:hypothetical protein
MAEYGEKAALAAMRGCVKRNQTVLASDAEIVLAMIDTLTEALKFVRTDPCFRHLGSVTHDKVTDALGLTNILWPLDANGPTEDGR